MLRNVVGIVSGGSSGLGAATASHIVRHGGRVIVADLPHTKDNFLRLAASSCAEANMTGEVAEGFSCDLYFPGSKGAGGFDGVGIKKGSDAVDGPVMAFAEMDVRSEDEVGRALDLAEQTFKEPVNVAVSCAGIAPAQRTISKKPSNTTNTLRIHSLTDYADALQVNALGTFNLARLAAERMAYRDPDAEGLRGCIVNTASIAAFEGQTGQVAYAASKGAVVGMTLPLARDLAVHGIRVMTVAPGLFKTPLLEGLPDSVQRELGDMVPCPSRLGYPDEFGAFKFMAVAGDLKFMGMLKTNLLLKLFPRQ